MNATAGTTVYGAVDPLEAIADVCSAHSLWMHVDVRQQVHTELPGNINEESHTQLQYKIKPVKLNLH